MYGGNLETRRERAKLKAACARVGCLSTADPLLWLVGLSFPAQCQPRRRLSIFGPTKESTQARRPVVYTHTHSLSLVHTCTNVTRQLGCRDLSYPSRCFLDTLSLLPHRGKLQVLQSRVRYAEPCVNGYAEPGC